MTMSDSSSGLKRGLTLVPAAAIIIAVVIGPGVFVKACVMTCNVGSPGLVLGVYALAGVLTLAGALVYAELATMMPRAGGAYNYLGSAFGRRTAFLYGWMETFIGNGAGLTAIAILFVVFLNDLVGGALALWTIRLLPLGVLGVVVVLNLVSVRASGHAATALTAVKVALVLGIGVGATVLIIVLYVLANTAYFYVLAPEAGAGVSPTSSVAREVAVRFPGAGAASVMAAGLVLSSFGTLYTSVLATSRVPFAMARDGLLPTPLAEVSPPDTRASMVASSSGPCPAPGSHRHAGATAPRSWSRERRAKGP